MSKPDHYWLPIVALFSGARREEIASLKATNVKTIDGVSCFQIEGGKTADAWRVVPIHPQLKALASMDYAQQVQIMGAEYLSPNLIDGANRRCKNAGRQFGILLDKRGIKDDRKVFHSFRHAVITRLPATDANVAHVMQITGHRGENTQGVHFQTYTHDMGLLALAETLEKLAYPLDCQTIKASDSSFKVGGFKFDTTVLRYFAASCLNLLVPMNSTSQAPQTNPAVKVILERVTFAMGEKIQPKSKSKVWLTRVYYWLGLGSFLLALVLAVPLMYKSGAQIYGEYADTVREAILGLLVVCYLTIIVYGIGAIVVSLAGLKKFFTRPHEAIMQNVYKTAESDFEHFQLLLNQDVKDLRYALRHLKSEIEFFEARTSLIIGSVAKVGIFPALVAFFALTQKMAIPSNSFLQALVYAMPALYFLSFYDVSVRAKMARQGALLELAVSEIEAKGKKSSERKTPSKYGLRTNHSM